MDTALRTVIGELSAVEHLLVGVDFDGTLAPLADEPMDAAPVTGAMPALHALAEFEHVTVALVSGRALGPLQELSAAEASIVLIGSHGAESSGAAQLMLDDRERDRFNRIELELSAVLQDHPGARVERKPTALVLHTRGLAPEAARTATADAVALAQRHDGVVMTRGKDVVELAVTEADKGSALLNLAESVDADVIVYAGDDVTDEHAFEQLRGADVSVKVGPGETSARYRVSNEHNVVAMLELLLAVRTSGEKRRAEGGLGSAPAAAL